MITFYGLIALGSIAPDIDHPKSKIGKIFRPFSDIIYKVFGHRTISHSLVFLIVMFTISILIWNLNIIIISLFLGMLFHIAGDMMTPSGCCLLYPIKKRRYKLLTEKQLTELLEIKKDL